MRSSTRSGMLTYVPASNRSWTISVYPSIAAIISAVLPSLSVIFMLGFLLSSSFTTSVNPPRTATISAVIEFYRREIVLGYYSVTMYFISTFGAPEKWEIFKVCQNSTQQTQCALVSHCMKYPRLNEPCILLHNHFEFHFKTQSAYRSFLVHIGTVLQQVHHTVIMAFSGSPDQGCSAILTMTT